MLEDKLNNEENFTGAHEEVDISDAEATINENKNFEKKMDELSDKAQSFNGSIKEKQLYFDKEIYVALTNKDVNGFTEKLYDSLFLYFGKNVYRDKSKNHLEVVDKSITKSERELRRLEKIFTGEEEFTPVKTLDEFVERSKSIPDSAKGAKYKYNEAKTKMNLYEKKVEQTERALLKFYDKEEELNQRITDIRKSNEEGSFALISELEYIRDEAIQKQEDALQQITDYANNKKMLEQEFKVEEINYIEEKENLNKAKSYLNEQKLKRKFLTKYINTQNVAEYGQIIAEISKTSEALKGFDDVTRLNKERREALMPATYKGKSTFSQDLDTTHTNAVKFEKSKRIDAIKAIKNKYK